MPISPTFAVRLYKVSRLFWYSPNMISLAIPHGAHFILPPYILYSSGRQIVSVCLLSLVVIYWTPNSCSILYLPCLRKSCLVYRPLFLVLRFWSMHNDIILTSADLLDPVNHFCFSLKNSKNPNHSMSGRLFSSLEVHIPELKLGVWNCFGKLLDCQLKCQICSIT